MSHTTNNGNTLDFSMKSFNQAVKEKLGNKKIFTFANSTKTEIVLVFVANSLENALDYARAKIEEMELNILVDPSDLTEVEITKSVCVIGPGNFIIV